MRTLTRSLLVLAVAFALVAFASPVLACNPTDPGCQPNNPVVEMELAGTEIGNGDAPVLEIELAGCEPMDSGCGDAPVLELV